MLKAVNIEGYRFGIYEYSRGFAIIDTETDEFLGYPGSDVPYVLERKKYIQACIDAHYETILTDRIPYTKKLA